MADKKLTELTALGSLSTDDLFYVVDDPFLTLPTSKRLSTSILDARYLLEANDLSDLDNAATARGNLGVAIGSDVQAYDADLSAIAALSNADSNFIVGSAGGWVAESGATARTSLGLGSIATQAANNVSISGGAISGITDLAIADGGTGQSSQQAAINALSAVSGATNEHVLTKDTGTGNAIFKAAAGGGAPTDAEYVVIALDGDLSDERVLTGTANQISIADGGANGNVTLSTPQDIHTGASPTFVSVTLTGTIEIPTTTSTAGQIIQNSVTMFHTYGTSNIFIGPAAGNFTMSSANNVAIGAFSMASLTSGGNNVALGFQSLNSNTTGSENFALGFNCLYANIDGINNVGIGYNALRFNVSGSNNVAIGTYALSRNTTATNCVGLGVVALYSNTEGLYNVGIGRGTLYYNQTGDSNVAIGYKAGEGTSINSHDNNVFIGFEAGTSISTGGNNVLLGYKAGDVITTGDDNIIIGYDLDPSAAGVSDELNIGALIMGYLAAHGSGPAINFMGGTPQAQQAHIVDADGNLADITTKFNTLLADLEGYGLLAAS